MKLSKLMLALCLSSHCALAGTNALIEVKLFKDWVLEGERNFGNLAIKNTGTDPILLAKNPFHFEIGQLVTRPLPHKTNLNLEQEENYRMIAWEGGEFFDLLPGEIHIYDGRKFYLLQRASFSDEMHFVVSVYLGKGIWLDSDPITYRGVIPDSEEELTTIANNSLARQGNNLNDIWKLVAVTHKNERWLYKKSPRTNGYYAICPLSLTNKIRIEPHNDETLFKIWDGEKSMIYDMYKNILTEGPDENNVLGKWTRDRKQKAEADNAEVRRKKAEAQTQ